MADELLVDISPVREAILVDIGPVREAITEFKLAKKERKTIEALLNVCRKMLELRSSCSCKGGGSAFSTIVDSKLSMSSSSANTMCRIADHPFFCEGENERLFERLPRGMYTVSVLIQLTEEQIEDAIDSGEIHPSMKGASATKFVREKLAREVLRRVIKPSKKLDSTQEGEMNELFSDDWCRLADIIPPNIEAAAKDFMNIDYIYAETVLRYREQFIKDKPSISGQAYSQLRPILIRLARLNQSVVKAHLKQFAPKYNKSKEESLKKELLKQRKLTEKLAKGHIAISELNLRGIPKAEARVILGALHPDKQGGNTRAFQIFQGYIDKSK